MRKLLFMLLIGSSTMVFAHQEPIVKTEVQDQSIPILLLENEYVTITGESYEFKGGSYLKVVFTNKTNEPIRCMYAIHLNGERQLINYDGTVEAIISIEAHGSFTYGDNTENNPIIELKNDWEHTTKIQFTLLK